LINVAVQERLKQNKTIKKGSVILKQMKNSRVFWQFRKDVLGEMLIDFLVDKKFT
jgi:hypothetical protein